MSLVQTPITAIASNYQGLYVTVSSPLVSSIFNNFSSANQLSFLPGLFSSTWCNLNFGSTIYVSTLISPYAVIVGPDNTVGGIYTLTAGISNSNFGSNAFVGGCNSYGADANIIAYGTGVGAISTNAAAFGRGTWATVPNSVAFGHSSMTFIGSNQHAHGELSIADGTASHAEGWSTIVYSDFSHVEGNDTQIWSGVASHAEGIDTWISSLGASHVEGLSTFVYGGEGSHAEGAFTVADVGVAHAEGEATIALGSTSHTQGFFNIVSTFQRNVGVILSNVAASNAHVEGACNLCFMPNSHVQGISSLNQGWINHLDGCNNMTVEIIGSMEGGCNMSDSPLIYNNSTFIKSFSNVFTFNRTNGTLDGIATGYSDYIYSIINHTEGISNYVSAPTFFSHIEGGFHSTCATNVHIEGAYNVLFSGRNIGGTSRVNGTIGQGTHIEGYSNTAYGSAGQGTAGSIAMHIEGASNVANGNPKWSHPHHIEGCGNVMSNIGEGKFNHLEGSNAPGLNVNATVIGNTGFFYIHKEGVNNVYTTTLPQLMHITGENNAGNSYHNVTGYSNRMGGFNNSVFGQYNSNGGSNSVIYGISNYTNTDTPIDSAMLGSYGFSYSNNNIGTYMYGGVAFFHSTNTSIIRGSAQSAGLNLITMTSSPTAFFPFRLFGTYLQTAPSLLIIQNRQSNIPFYTFVNTDTNYPAFNQIANINVYEMKLTGYQCSRTDAAASLGFYSGDYLFAIYRDNTPTASNLCVFDLVSLSTVRTNTIASATAQVSTIIKPQSEQNKLFNTTQVNLRVTASNIQQNVGALGSGQRAQFYLDLKINSAFVTNWMLQTKVSQVIRP